MGRDSGDEARLTGEQQPGEAGQYRGQREGLGQALLVLPFACGFGMSSDLSPTPRWEIPAPLGGWRVPGDSIGREGRGGAAVCNNPVGGRGSPRLGGEEGLCTSPRECSGVQGTVGGRSRVSAASSTSSAVQRGRQGQGRQVRWG